MMGKWSFREHRQNLSAAGWVREGKGRALVVCLSGAQ